MNRKQFENRNSSLHREEIDRKWRALLAEQEQLQWILEQEFINQQTQQQRSTVAANNTFGGLGGGGGRNTGNQTSSTFYANLDTSTWHYFFSDFNSATFSYTVDTGLDIGTYSLSANYTNDRGGYFRSLSNGSNSHAFFFTSDGDLINEFIFDTPDVNIRYTRNHALIKYGNYMWVFDGKNLKDVSSIAEGDPSSISMGSLIDGGTSQGIIVRIVTPIDPGVSEIERIYIVNAISEPLVISEHTRVVGEESQYLYQTSIADDKGENIFIILVDDDTGFYLNLDCYRVSGTPLVKTAIAQMPIAPSTNFLQYRGYGEGNLFAMFYPGGTSGEYQIAVNNGQFADFTHPKDSYPYWNISSSSPWSWSDTPYSNDLSLLFFSELGSEASWTEVDSLDLMYFSSSFPGDCYSSTFLPAGSTSTFFIAADSINLKSDFRILPIASSDDRDIQFRKISYGDYYDTPMSISIDNYPQIQSESQGEVVRYNATGGTNSGKIFSSVNAETYDSLTYTSNLFTAIISGNCRIDRLDYDYWYFTSLNNNGSFSILDFGIGDRNMADSFSTPTLTRQSILADKGSVRSFWFNDANQTPTEIDDGGWDIYDGANRILADGIEVPYTHSQMDIISPYSTSDEALESWFEMNGTAADGVDWSLGEGSSYFTNVYPGLFVFVADNVSLPTFGIDGNIGADGDGSVSVGQYNTTGLSGSTYTAYTKTVYNGEDPSIFHVIIVNTDGTGITRDFNQTASDDYDVLQGVGDVTQIHYLMFTLGRGTTSGDVDFETLIDEYISLVDGKSLNQMLSTINESYQTITNVLPPRTSEGYIRFYREDGSIVFFSIESELYSIRFNETYLLGISANIYNEGKLDIIVIDVETGETLHTISTDILLDDNRNLRVINDRIVFEYRISSRNYYYIINRDTVNLRIFDADSWNTQYNDFTWWDD